MTRVLLAAHPTVGHTNALRSIGRMLLSEGHQVAMAMARLPGPDSRLLPPAAREAFALPEAIRRDGIDLFQLGASWSSLWHGARIAGSTGYDELGHALELFSAGLVGHATTIQSAIQTWQAQVVVADYLMFAAWLGTRRPRVPLVAFYHSALPFPSPDKPPFGSGLLHGEPGDSAWVEAQRRLDALAARMHERVRTATRRLGLDDPPPGMLSRPYSEDLNLLATLPELEPGMPALDAPVSFCGPCLTGRSDAGETDPALRVLREGVARIYVSLGTVFNSKPRLFEAILQGLDSADFQVIVSAGASMKQLSRRSVSRNSHLFERVAQVALLDRVDVVVTHGGNNTTLESLAAGKPMLVIPFGGDQIENARRVELLGVGLALRASEVTPRTVHDAISRLLEEDTFRRSAARAAAALHGVDGTRRAVTAILDVADRGPPPVRTAD